MPRQTVHLGERESDELEAVSAAPIAVAMRPMLPLLAMFSPGTWSVDSRKRKQTICAGSTTRRYRIHNQGSGRIKVVVDGTEHTLEPGSCDYEGSNIEIQYDAGPATGTYETV